MRLQFPSSDPLWHLASCFFSICVKVVRTSTFRGTLFHVKSLEYCYCVWLFCVERVQSLTAVFPHKWHLVGVARQQNMRYLIFVAATGTPVKRLFYFASRFWMRNFQPFQHFCLSFWIPMVYGVFEISVFMLPKVISTRRKCIKNASNRYNYAKNT